MQHLRHTTRAFETTQAFVDTTASFHHTPIRAVHILGQVLKAACLIVAMAIVLLGHNPALANREPYTASRDEAANNLIAQFVVGKAHGCALTHAGAVRCWGSNTLGQLGSNNPIRSSTPVPVSGLDSGITTISTGYEHTCAITEAGAALCWGNNSNGQLGNDTTDNSAVPVAVSGLNSGVIAIATGHQHTCALTDTAAVLCWGDNTAGQLGNGLITNSPTPVQVSSLNGIPSRIAAGFMHTCVVTNAGGVECWGLNNNGQLGDGTTTDQNTPITVSGLETPVTAITTGATHTCSVSSSGAVHCWGANNYKQVGNETVAAWSTRPVAVASLSNGIIAIAAGHSHTCALSIADTVSCWGRDNYGQLSGELLGDSETPREVTGLNNGIASLAAGESMSCGLSEAGSIQCWGDNTEGSFGNGVLYFSPTPLFVSGLDNNVTALAVGGSHGCTLSGNSIQCWGRNFSGELGSGVNSSQESSPVTVTGLNQEIIKLQAGQVHTCALSAVGAAFCWGNNNEGQLGTGDTINRNIPTQVAGLEAGIRDIAPAQEHTCALTNEDAVLCWGKNTNGQLGDGTQQTRLTPTPVNDLSTGIQTVATGSEHTCALTNEGAVLCWGNNTNGQLGNGTYTGRSSTPTPVNGLDTGIIAIVSGSDHICALSEEYEVLCWGTYSNGQYLGDHIIASNVPTLVNGLDSDIVDISSGYDHTCVLSNAGKVLCWGNNERGQLGDGSTVHRPLPVAFIGLNTGITAIAAGGQTTCALFDTDTVQCWGSNHWGQLGAAADPFSTKPAQVAFTPQTLRTSNGHTVEVTFTSPSCRMNRLQFHPAPNALPSSLHSMPYGLADWEFIGCATGASMQVSLTFPDTLDTSATLYAYLGGTAWQAIPGASINGNTATFSITDQSLLDMESAQGVMRGWSGVALVTADDTPVPAQAHPVPIFNHLALLTLSLLVGGVAMRRHRCVSAA